MKHLLVPTDFSDAAQTMLDGLDALRSFGADTVTLLHVRPTGLGIRPNPKENEFDQQRLDDLANALRNRGWTVQTRLESGRPADKINALANATDADHIVIANRGKSAVESVMLGSIAASVLEEAPQPIFLFNVDAPAPGDEASDPWDRLVFPTDFSDASQAAADRAIDLALQAWLPVTLFHAVDTRYHSQPHLDEQRTRIKSLAQRFRDAGVKDVSTQVIPERPKKAILEVADHYPSALFVMGTHGRGFFGDLILGGVSRTMARRGGHHSLFVPVD